MAATLEKQAPTTKAPTKKGFYADQFRADERRLMTDETERLSLADEIWMQRVMNRRLLERITRADPDELSLEMLMEAVRTLAMGTRQVAQLMREEEQTRALGAKNNAQAQQISIMDAINRGLDELSEEIGMKL